MPDEPRSAERRAYYRLPYPETERPTMWVGNHRYAVVEISEMGARVLIAGREPLPQQGPVAGLIRFHDGELVAVQGTVLRVEAAQAVLKLTVGISLPRMLVEQRRLLQLYPTLFDPPAKAST
jgi:hypothetical protein